MSSEEHELKYLSAGSELLEKFLLATEIYWPIGIKAPAGEPPYPQLTLGNMILARLRARALAPTMKPDQRSELAQLEENISAIRNHWRVAWSKKAVQEFHARLFLWRDYLEEYRDQPEVNVDRYPYEVTRRVQMHFLSWEAEKIPNEEIDLLGALDKLLRAVFIPGDFIWENYLASSLPISTFWYLYGKPRTG